MNAISDKNLVRIRDLSLFENALNISFLWPYKGMKKRLKFEMAVCEK